MGMLMATGPPHAKGFGEGSAEAAQSSEKQEL
jgi:hypothetical protein